MAARRLAPRIALARSRVRPGGGAGLDGLRPSRYPLSGSSDRTVVRRVIALIGPPTPPARSPLTVSTRSRTVRILSERHSSRSETTD